RGENGLSSIMGLLRNQRLEARTVIQAFGPGSSNGEIVEEASRSDEIIITLGSDFLKLHPNPRTRILIVDVHPAIPSTIGQVLESHLDHSLQLLRKAQTVKLTKAGPVSVDT